MNTATTEIYTGNDSVPSGTWTKITIQYTATTQGVARLYVNGATQPAWGIGGDLTRTANLQRLQLWNEGLSANDFDGIAVSTTAPLGANPPGAPGGVAVA